LGVAVIGGVMSRNSSTDTSDISVALPLSPAPFSTPARFSFETVKVNELGQIIKRLQKQARYFSEDLGNGVLLEMVEIPAGEFLMGSPASEPQRASDEGPQRRGNVPLFFMGRFAVTQAQWQQVIRHNPANFKGEQRPVERVSWDNAQEFCKRLSQQTGRTYRLPSEAEWEYACRAGTTTPFHFGPTITPELVNYNGNYPYGSAAKGKNRAETTPVGSFPANGFGLHDMHGNVWEWCENFWQRGGSWDNSSWFCRSAIRNRWDSAYRSFNYGLRVVCSAP
jgi:eukaryotic-like serine/threonine-protein kinase